MIRFLRQIRQQLIVENKIGNYLKYAIGEILLVVVGILLALQINNWNENRKDRINEKKVLSSLLEDFRYSQSKIKNALDQNQNEIKRLEASLSYIGKDSHELDQKMRDSIRYTAYSSVEIAEGSIQSVLSTEKLELIINDSLKSLLTAYPSQSSRFKSAEMNVKELVINLHRPILESYVSLTEEIAKDVDRFPLLKKSAVPSDYVGLLKTIKYQNVLMNRLITSKQLIKTGENFLNKIEEIIYLIEKEMKKK